MAEGVESAAAIVCFLTKEYQQSDSCKKELTYASQRGIPIIPCMMIVGWKPSSWLGISITDLLYLDFKNITEQNLNMKCQTLVEKIKQTVGTKCSETDEQQIWSAVETKGYASESDDEHGDVNTDFSSKIPKPQRQGPELIAVEPPKTKKHVCEGDSVIRLLTPGNILQIEANQNLSAYDGTFINYFFIPKIIIQNTSKQPVSIIEFTAEYENQEGIWCECKTVNIGPPSNNGEYTWLADSVINLEPAKLMTFALEVQIVVQGKPGRDNQRRARAHISLPQPLKIRVQAHDTDGKTCSLIVEQANTPLQLPTKEFLMTKCSITNIISYVYVDDCEDHSRRFVIIYLNDESILTFAFGDSLHGLTPRYWDKSTIKKLQKQAKENGNTEIVLDDWSSYGQYTALFDPITFILYAVRIELVSDTSKTEETVLLPLKQIK
ncbi:unnamed protein product [Didymodactylos carnosus]|uniref:TIR domain-containing protein n=1 Tax=Didymodactylos carnosus TaxID=1234261 RepID=A0A815KBV8_9BILA|nr:unnamed protein product [Didymodactylos carnosus]CAF1393723.1 unnamed protein product [Didymodactylos carnosus]CAF3674499.1 unnamed protein product [Didymodactylos carnosus]CAF4287967.1 unnamed protein product [Didymodactylos carnosus]